MNKKFLKHYMETNPEGIAQTYIFLVDNQDIALNIVMSGYQALCLVQEDDGDYFSADSFIEEMRAIQFTGSCQCAYYRQVEAACEEAGRNAGESDGGEGRITGEKSEDERVYPEISGKDTQAENGKTEAIFRESRNARRNSEVKRRNSSFDNRTVRNAEAESIASEEQRRFEEQKRIEEQERARAARRRNKRRSGPEL
ncbi:Uncharacterised protein [uncultured Blautia sp.]|nr:hypothetical protein [uncultured Blautia sp.]SCH00095.1 Uncharacterised protein [uncultured Blautia sp.]